MGYPAVFSPPWDSPSNAIACLNALAPVDPWAPNLSVASNLATQIFPEGFSTVTTIPKTSITPYAYWIFNGSNVMLVVGGTDGTQVPSLLSSWLSGQTAGVPAGALQAFYNSCLQLFNSAPPGRIGNGLNWWLIGHSFGGAVVEVMARIAAQLYSPASVYAWTFGSPRPGTDQFQTLQQGVNLYRFFNAEDVVAVVPPHTNEGPLLHFALPDSAALFVNRQVQIPNGRRIAADGTITNTEETTVPFPIVEPSLAAWVLGLNIWQAQSHSPAEYRRRLLLSPAPPANPIGPNRTPPSQWEPPLDISVRLLHRQVDEAINRLPTPTIPNGLPVMIGASPASRYSIRHRRGGWGVWYQGNMVAFSRTKRGARKIARTGNMVNKANGQLVKS